MVKITLSVQGRMVARHVGNIATRMGMVVRVDCSCTGEGWRTEV